MSKSGNTYGKVTGDTPKAGVPAERGNPAENEQNILEAAQGATKGAIDDWVESTGYNQGAMVAGAVATAVVEVFMPTAWWELVPVGKAAKIIKKGGEAVGVLNKGEKAAETAKDAKKADDASKAGGTSKAEKKPESGDGRKDTQVKNKRTGEKGKCGEWLARQDMMQEGFDEVIEVQNNSGHGVDLIGRNSKTGEVKVWEVKTTDGGSAPSLSKDQREMGGADYTKDRLGRAARGDGNYGKVPEAMANARKAKDWLAKAGDKVVYEKREVFIEDIEKGCMKNSKRPSRSKSWDAKE